jgi:hypothetical protein
VSVSGWSKVGDAKLGAADRFLGRAAVLICQEVHGHGPRWVTVTFRDESRPMNIIICVLGPLETVHHVLDAVPLCLEIHPCLQRPTWL